MSAHDGKIDRNSRKYFDARRSALIKERSSFISHYKDLSQFIQPRRGRFIATDRNIGTPRHQNIINSRATWALRVARAGMFAGVMSPARPWFRLETNDPGLMEFQPVILWLDQVEEAMRGILIQGNLYNMSPVLLGELLLFGTGCMLHVDDHDDVARFFTQTVGSYMIAQNDRFDVTTLVREYQQTVNQLVSEFGLDKVTTAVKTAYNAGNYEQWFDVVHFIEPNPNFDPKKLNSEFKRFRSVKYQPASNDGEKKFLSKKGFDRFPAYCPRWDVTGEDVYGTNCPAMESLGDIKQLQMEEKRKAQGIAKMVNPPLKGPASLKNSPISAVPGGVTLFDGGQGNETLGPLYQVNPQLNELTADIQRVEKRIEDNFFVDMFLAISNMEGIQPKNQLELSQRQAEKLLQLGPVLERVNGEFLDKMIDRLFEQMVEREMLPPAPEELQGQPLVVRFISSLAQAQKSVATGDIDRLAGYVTGLVKGGYEQVLDKFDADQSVDLYQRLVGAPAQLIVPDESVAATREARQEKLQQQQNIQLALEAAKVGGGVLKDLGATDLEGDNVASRTAGALQNVAGESAGNQNQ
ncbi:MAG TPA: phage tail protein [Actinobacteria bacterium]|nr:phage tail protein [Actinomycetota bacterium]